MVSQFDLNKTQPFCFFIAVVIIFECHSEFALKLINDCENNLNQYSN